MLQYFLVKAVIFDFDGTVADSLFGVLAFMDNSREHNIPHTSDEVENFRNKSFLAIARQLKIPTWRLLVLAVFGRRMLTSHIDKIKTYHGVAPLLKKLYKAEIRVYVVSTNKPQTIHAFLRAHGLDTYVRAVYGNAFFLNKAPKLKTLLRQEGLRPEEVVSVGDELVDVMSGHQAGMKVLSVSWGYTAHETLDLANKGNVYDSVKKLEKAIIT